MESRQAGRVADLRKRGRSPRGRRAAGKGDVTGEGRSRARAGGSTPGTEATSTSGLPASPWTGEWHTTVGSRIGASIRGVQGWSATGRVRRWRAPELFCDRHAGYRRRRAFFAVRARAGVSGAGGRRSGRSGSVRHSRRPGRVRRDLRRLREALEAAGLGEGEDGDKEKCRSSRFGRKAATGDRTWLSPRRRRRWPRRLAGVRGSPVHRGASSLTERGFASWERAHRLGPVGWLRRSSPGGSAPAAM